MQLTYFGTNILILFTNSNDHLTHGNYYPTIKINSKISSTSLVYYRNEVFLYFRSKLHEQEEKNPIIA